MTSSVFDWRKPTQELTPEELRAEERKRERRAANNKKAQAEAKCLTRISQIPLQERFNK